MLRIFHYIVKFNEILLFPDVIEF